VSTHMNTKNPRGRKRQTFRDLFGKIWGSAVSPARSETYGPTTPESLCSTCRNVDWNAVLDGNSPSPVRKVLEINLLNASKCRVCHFLLQSLGPFPPLARHDVLAVKINPKLTPYPCTVDAFVLGLVPKWDFGFRNIWSFNSNVIFEVCEPVNRTLKPIQPLVDLGVVKLWLDNCLDTHPDRCRPSGTQADDLHVIDCSTRRIIAHPSGTAYVTLSYVWGQVARQHSEVFSAAQAMDERSLPSHTPQTVEDALQVTLQLGYKYLWVDKYCMDPNSGHFHTQLKQMNRVYQNSVLTIIAAAGSDSSYGLPGVSRHRIGSPQVRVGNHTLTSIPQSVLEEFGESLWFTRGWTYQEGLLSTRRLIFLERQVYYECQSDWWYEGIIATPQARSCVYRPGGSERGETVGVFAADRTGSHDIDIKSRIAEYSERLLTNENDILNALLGIFELFYQSFNVRHLWGVPYPTKDVSMAKADSPSILQRMYFLISLGWVSQSSSTRRSAFPSWSWTGWFHAVNMDHGDLTPAAGNKPLWGPRWYNIVDTDWKMHVEKADGTLIDWASCKKSHDSLPASSADTRYHEKLEVQELSKYLHIIAYVSRILPPKGDDASTYPTLEPITPLDKPYRVLVRFDLDNCSPETHELYALHMPWSQCQWMIVIHNLGNHWERAGLAFFRGNWGSERKFTTKKSMMKIRLG
jgi:hypothetical protein